MPVRSPLRAGLAPAFVLAALLVAGCGGADGSADAAGAHATAPEPRAEVRSWDVGAPYLPPPDPSLLRHAQSDDGDAVAAGAPDAGAGNDAGSPASSTRGAATTQDAPPDAGEPDSGAPSDAQVAADLREAYGGKGGTDLDQAAIDRNGLAVIPSTAPAKLVALMQGANEVARKPYVYGGGHGRNPNEIWQDTAYDCSGSLSYALAAAGYLEGPVDSSTLMRWGKPGPGKWVTIYSNAGHAFMVVAGLRFDTSGRQVTGTRWQSANARSYAGFVVRHPPGL